jgi:transposase
VAVLRGCRFRRHSLVTWVTVGLACTAAKQLGVSRATAYDLLRR